MLTKQIKQESEVEKIHKVLFPLLFRQICHQPSWRPLKGEVKGGEWLSFCPFVVLPVQVIEVVISSISVCSLIARIINTIFLYLSKNAGVAAQKKTDRKFE